jgi:hypothetical protein
MLVRMDAFLSNVIEFLFIGLFITVVSRFLGLISLASGLLVIQGLVLAVLSSHFIYSIVYTVNDYLDYPSINSIVDKSSQRYSFYRFRPLIYFGNRKSVLLFLVGLYLTATVLTISAIPTATVPILLFSTVLLVVSLSHSHFKGLYRVLSFSALRLTKYLLFIVLFSSFIHLSLTAVLAAFALIIPYWLYVSYGFGKERKIISKPFFRTLLLGTAIIVFYFIYISMVLTYFALTLFMPLAIGYCIVVPPFFGVQRIGYRLFGLRNADFTVHIKRLSAGLFFTLMIVLLEIFILF